MFGRRGWTAGGGQARAGGVTPPVLAAHPTSWIPDDPDLANGNPITLGGRFTAASTVALRGVAFFAPATNAGSYTAALWRTTGNDDVGAGTGVLLGQVTVAAAAVTAAAWNYLPVPLTAVVGLVYTAGVWTSTGRFVRTAGTYTGGAVAGHGITFIQSGTDPNPPGLGTLRNGDFADDPTSAGVAYPLTGGSGADYGVDVWL